MGAYVKNDSKIKVNYLLKGLKQYKGKFISNDISIK